MFKVKKTKLYVLYDLRNNNILCQLKFDNITYEFFFLNVIVLIFEFIT